MQVLMAIKKDNMRQVIIDNQFDLICHLYYLVIDTKKLDFLTKRVWKKTKIVNLYDNKVARGHI